MRALLYTLGICLFLLAPGAAWAQGNQPAQSQQQKQAAQPSASATSQEAAPHPSVITAEEKARKNPAKFTQDSVDKGSHLYTTQCAMCHGKSGDGKGDLATVMHVSPPDFTKPDTLAARTDGELFTIINKGSGTMPAEGDRLKENQAWDLVNYLRFLEGKKPAKPAGHGPGAAKP